MFPSSDPGCNTEMEHRKPPSLGGGGEQGPANAQGNVGMAEQDWDVQDGNGNENQEAGEEEEEGQQQFKKKYNRLTLTEYYKYQLMQQLPVEVKSHPLLYKLILQQWIVEAYHKIEVDRLHYVRYKLQPKLRAYHLAPEDRPQTTDDYDRIIIAELPDKDTEPELYQIVTQNMLHGLCGARCQKDGRCQGVSMGTVIEKL